MWWVRASTYEFEGEGTIQSITVWKAKVCRMLPKCFVFNQLWLWASFLAQRNDDLYYLPGAQIIKMSEPFWASQNCQLSLLSVQMGTDCSIWREKIIQDFSQRFRWSHRPDNYQFTGDTKLRGADLCNTWARMEFRIIWESRKAELKLWEENLHEYFGNTDVLIWGEKRLL